MFVCSVCSESERKNTVRCASLKLPEIIETMRNGSTIILFSYVNIALPLFFNIMTNI